jgi:hypothetical protein
VPATRRAGCSGRGSGLEVLARPVEEAEQVGASGETGRVGAAEEEGRVGDWETACGQQRKQIRLEEAVQTGAAEDAVRVGDGGEIDQGRRWL